MLKSSGNFADQGKIPEKIISEKEIPEKSNNSYLLHQKYIDIINKKCANVTVKK